jgi:hypothetical protein
LQTLSDADRKFIASGSDAETTVIRLDRLPKAGSVIEVASATEQTGELGPALAPAKRQGVTGKFNTTANIGIRIVIDEVDADGLTTKATYQIVRCDMVTPPRGKTPSYITGMSFEVSVVNGKRRYLGRTGVANERWILEEPNASMLDAAVPLRFFQGEATLDDLFGTAQPQKSGANWTAEPQAIADAFSHLGAKQERAAGKSTLQRARGNLLTVASGLELSGLKYELPDGYALAEDKFQMQLITAISSDESALPGEQTSQRYTSISGTSEGKKIVEWLRETGQSRYKLVK